MCTGATCRVGTQEELWQNPHPDPMASAQAGIRVDKLSVLLSNRRQLQGPGLGTHKSPDATSRWQWQQLRAIWPRVHRRKQGSLPV